MFLRTPLVYLASMGSFNDRLTLFLVAGGAASLGVIGVVRPVTNALTGAPGATVSISSSTTTSPNSSLPGGTTSTTSPTRVTTPVEDPNDSPPPAPDWGDAIVDLDQRLDAVITRVDTLSGALDDTADVARDAKSIAKSVSADLATIRDDLAGTIGDITRMKQDVAGALERLTIITDQVARKLSKMNNDGNYTGPLAPNQILPQLRPSDIAGDWPLNRTTDYLDASKINVDFGGCYADSRYNTVLSVDPFRRLQCLRLPR